MFSGCLHFTLKDGFPTQVGISQKTSIFHSEGPLWVKSSRCLVQITLPLRWLNYYTLVQLQQDKHCYTAFNTQSAHPYPPLPIHSLDKSKSRLPLPKDQHHFLLAQAEVNFLKLNLSCQSFFPAVFTES